MAKFEHVQKLVCRKNQISPATESAEGVIKYGTSIAKDSAKLLSRNSIMNTASEGIFQYPIIMSSNIPDDDAIIISKGFERTYASSVVISLGLNPMVDLNKETVQNYLSKFHNNKGIPFTVRGMKGLTESATDTTLEDCDFAIESAVAYSVDNTQLKDLSMKCWECVSEQLDMQSLNDIYQPYKRTQKLINMRMDAATEASSKPSNFDNAMKRASVDRRGSDLNRAGDKNNTAGYLTKRRGTARAKNFDNIATRSTRNAVKDNKALTAMEPTMITVTLLMHNSNGGQETLSDITLGVKAMVRSVKSDMMVANMVEASKMSKAIFTFIRWAKGEIKTVKDVFLGIDEARRDANANSDLFKKTLAISKRRKKSDMVAKMLNHSVFPTLTVIMTTDEVAEVKNISGVDLGQLQNAMALLKKYYLLAFAIYDPTTNSLQTLFDSDDSFSFTSLGTMKKSIDKEINLTNARELGKLMGRM